MEWDDGDPDTVYAVPVREGNSAWGQMINMNKALHEEVQRHEKLSGLEYPMIGYFNINPILDGDKLRSPAIGNMLAIAKNNIGIIEDVVEIELP